LVFSQTGNNYQNDINKNLDCCEKFKKLIELRSFFVYSVVNKISFFVGRSAQRTA